MKDVFEVQDEIARKIAEALRITLSPQEQEALAAKPTENLQAYDLFLRGKSYARRLTRHDADFALQMFESAVAQDPTFALAHAAIANVCASYYYLYDRDNKWIERADARLRARRCPCSPHLPEVEVARGWIHYAGGDVEEAIRCCAACDRAQERLRGRLLPAAARPVRRRSQSGGGRRSPTRHSRRAGPTTTSTCRSRTRSTCWGRQRRCGNVRQRSIQALENHLKEMPEDARARTLLASDYASAQPRRGRDARGQPRDGAATRRGDGALQRGVHLRRARQEDRGDGRDAQGLEGGLSRSRSGRAATPTSRSSAASPSSSACTRRCPTRDRVAR